jgi:1-acyl-sn-glycerol-3-phosphate acyltransferase
MRTIWGTQALQANERRGIQRFGTARVTLLRSVLFQLYFWIVAVAMNISWLPSLVMPRRFSVLGMEWWTRATFWGLKHIAGLDYEIRGREHIVDGAAIYAIKHLSMWETMAVQILLHDPAQILKSELMWIPFYGWYALKSGQIVVDRGGHAKALRSMLTRAKRCVADGRPIVIFPEGTRKPIGAVPDYKPGVAALYGTLHVPCVRASSGCAEDRSAGPAKSSSSSCPRFNRGSSSAMHSWPNCSIGSKARRLDYWQKGDGRPPPPIQLFPNPRDSPVSARR